MHHVCGRLLGQTNICQTPATVMELRRLTAGTSRTQRPWVGLCALCWWWRSLLHLIVDMRLIVCRWHCVHKAMNVLVSGCANLCREKIAVFRCWVQDCRDDERMESSVRFAQREVVVKRLTYVALEVMHGCGVTV